MYFPKPMAAQLILWTKNNLNPRVIEFPIIPLWKITLSYFKTNKPLKTKNLYFKWQTVHS